MNKQIRSRQEALGLAQTVQCMDPSCSMLPPPGWRCRVGGMEPRLLYSLSLSIHCSPPRTRGHVTGHLKIKTDATLYWLAALDCWLCLYPTHSILHVHCKPVNWLLQPFTYWLGNGGLDQRADLPPMAVQLTTGRTWTWTQDWPKKGLGRISVPPAHLEARTVLIPVMCKRDLVSVLQLRIWQATSLERPMWLLWVYLDEGGRVSESERERDWKMLGWWL